MINQYKPYQAGVVLQSDMAGESPVYIYFSKIEQIFLYSTSITELLDDARVAKPLKSSDEGISFLLQSGVVPPPITAYQDIYIVSIGDTAEIMTVNGKIEVVFKHEFPFLNKHRLSTDEMQPNDDFILQLLAEASISRIDDSKSSFLFHSAGKDSNSIALALAEAGWQDKVILTTHKSKGKKDESEISKKIAKKLGFKHKILHEVDQLQSTHKQAIDEYFINAPFPCTDNVTLAYPLYATQMPELKGANIIFGDGNDSYMMTPPHKRNKMYLPYAKWSSKLVFARHLLNSESKFNPILRTPAEWFGQSGFSFKDCKNIFSNSKSVYSYWANESRLRDGWDIFDFKSDIYSTRTITERMIRKLHNFVDVNNSKLVLPFMDKKITEYFQRMPENYLFDRKQLTNKLVLRDLLKKRIGLDSDKVGKMGWTYDSRSIVLQNWTFILEEIEDCTLWNHMEILKVINRLKNVMRTHHKYANLSGQLIYRVYLLSAWSNRNKYLNG